MALPYLPIHHHRDTIGKKPIRLTPKEIANASADGYTVAVRPRDGGGFWVMGVRIEDGTVMWPEIAETREDIPTMVTSVLRSLDKFSNVGDDLSSHGRHRHKPIFRRVAEQWLIKK